MEAHRNGKTAYAIARNIGRSRSTVRDIIRRYVDTGAVTAKPHSGGRASTITPREDRALRGTILVDRRPSTAVIATKWAQAIGKEVSTATCRRRIHLLGYKFYKVRGLFLT